MLIPGIEPGITAYKTIVITTSLYELLITTDPGLEPGTS